MIEDDDVGNAHPVMLAEAWYLLDAHRNRFKADLRSSKSKTFRLTLKYLEDFCRVRSKSVVDDLRTGLAANFSEMEIALLGSLFPQSAEEARLLIPSLVSKDDHVLSQAVERLQQIV